MPLRHNTLLSMVVFILYPYVQYNFAQCLPLAGRKKRPFATGVFMRAAPGECSRYEKRCSPPRKKAFYSGQVP